MTSPATSLAPNLTPNQLTLLRRFDESRFYRAGELRGPTHRHAIGVQNGLRPLMAAGYVAWYLGAQTTYRITGAGLAARSGLDQVGLGPRSTSSIP